MSIFSRPVVISPSINGQDSQSSHNNLSMPNKISSEFASFVADVEDLIKNTTALSAAELDLAGAKLKVRMAHLKESVDGVSETLVTHARHTATVTDEYVHQKPWQVIGASAFVAFTLGVIFGRR